MASLSSALKLRQHWHSRTHVYAVAFLALLAMCILSMAWPARHIPQLVNLAPTTNQAGRRRYLTRSCVHFARELVLDDGLARMSKRELGSALRYYLQELRDADHAVRMGGLHDISVGADQRNEEHNRVMYQEGCGWREDPNDCSTEGRADVAAHGLQYLLVSFFDAVETVLARYAPPLESYSEDFMEKGEVPSGDAYTRIEVDTSRVALLSSDLDLAFVLSAFNGDVFQGLGSILQLFYAETAEVLTLTHTETRYLFGAYVLMIVLLFYVCLFRKTTNNALSEAAKARAIVMMTPSHTLKSYEVQAMLGYFVPAMLTDSDEQEGPASEKQAPARKRVL